MTIDTEKPFWQRPLPPINRPGDTVAALPEPQEELPPETVARGDGAGVSIGVSAPPSEARPVAPHDALRDAAHNLDVCRWRARQCRDAVAASRQAFNLALNAWNQTQPIQDVEGLKKEWIASNQRERERKAAAGQLRRPSTISEMAKAIGVGGHRAQRGGGVAYRRGAHSKADAMEIEAGKLRAAAVARKLLPSER